MTTLTPEFLLRLYAESPVPDPSLSTLVHHTLATSKESRNNCRHLAPLFDDQPEEVRYWDLYLAHSRWEGEQRWQAALEAAQGDPRAALEQLPTKPSSVDWGLVEALCESSRRLAASDHATAVALAQAAVERAGRAPTEVLEKACRHELKALAWATLSNAHRANDQLDPARETLDRALRQLEHSEPYLLGLGSAVLCLKAGLESSERNFQASLDTLASALKLGPPDPLRSRILVKRSVNLIALGNPLAALDSLREAVPLIDRHDDPRLWYSAVQHQLFILTELGRFDEAAPLLPEVQQLVAAGQTPVHQLQVTWIEARMARGQGDPADAEALFNETRQGFLKHQLAYRAAIVTLELAELLLEQGRLEEVKHHATGTLEEFRRQRVKSQYISALTLVEQAVARQHLTLEILRQARELVERRASR